MKGRDVLQQVKNFIQDTLYTGKRGIRGMMGDDGYVKVDHILRMPEIAYRGINLQGLEQIIRMSAGEKKGKSCNSIPIVP